MQQTVQDAVNHIQEKYDVDSTQHGLLYNKTWLEPSNHLAVYALKYGDVLELRKLRRVLKVSLMDKTYKSVLIDESLPVAKIVALICQKIGLANAIEYSLLPMHDRTLSSKDILGDESNNIQFSKKIVMPYACSNFI